ncbi:MAG: D-cysteine desulfhydrase family protein [Propionibacteriaceae bacterium]|jgi:D-cysteine desulfhydrase family pyridoxal phosphate-dependent enzyme|nr:D-cysteine desulfhydrase family protein [Propionibacteriaceae bacterium]
MTLTEPLSTFLAAFPRVELGFLPTPVHSLPRLSTQLSVATGRPVDIWIKRDDVTGLASGGNKARKLEYLIADAIALGRDTIVTGGGLQSNFARQTAAAAAKYGLTCVLGLHEGYLKTEEYARSGNVLLDELLGAEIRIYPTPSSADSVRLAAEELIAEGRNPYVIPVGGSNALGSLGYVQAALELVETVSGDQLPTSIVVPVGSNGTVAGLAAGLAAIGSRIEVVGMCVDDVASITQPGVLALIEDIVGLGLPRGSVNLRISDVALGEGYGVPTDGMREALTLAARSEGILLDPVYSGKAFAGMLAEIRQGLGLAHSRRILFWHTGGLPGIFPYRSELSV